MRTGKIVAVLLDDEELDAAGIAGGDHAVGVLERERHRLLDDEMLAVRRKLGGMLRVAAAFGEDADNVDLVLTLGEHAVKFGVSRDAVTRGELLGAGRVDIADGDEPPIGQIFRGEDVGIALGDAAAADQGKA